MAMTVQQLIEELQKIEDKSKDVYAYNADGEIRPVTNFEIAPDSIDILAEEGCIEVLEGKAAAGTATPHNFNIEIDGKEVAKVFIAGNARQVITAGNILVELDGKPAGKLKLD